MKIKHKTGAMLFLSLVYLSMASTSHGMGYTSSTAQLEWAKNTFNAALQCSQNYRQHKKQSRDCLSNHAALRSTSKQKKLAKWLATIELIDINHCTSTEIQIARKFSLHLTEYPQLQFCVHYYQKPFQKAAVVTIGQLDNSANWKIISLKEL